MLKSSVGMLAYRTLKNKQTGFRLPYLGIKLLLMLELLSDLGIDYSAS